MFMVVYLWFLKSHILMKTKNNTEDIHIRLPKDMKLKVEELSEKIGLTTSAYIKLLIHNAISN